jgi:hypothetical protein
MEHLEPKRAFQYLHDHPDAVFIDCRSEMEYMFVGHAVGSMMVPWYDGAEWELNPTARCSSSAAAAIAAWRRARRSRRPASGT